MSSPEDALRAQLTAAEARAIMGFMGSGSRLSGLPRLSGFLWTLWISLDSQSLWNLWTSWTLWTLWTVGTTSRRSGLPIAGLGGGLGAASKYLLYSAGVLTGRLQRQIPAVV